MTNADRLSALDSAFLHLESRGPSHMHVASVMIFDGDAPSLREFVEHVQRRLHLVPRYRQRLAFVPFDQGRPVWVDDPHFNPYYHIRHAALPAPADEDALKELAGRLFSERLHRHRPLWELWLVERLQGGRFAIIAKAHHALVDGISGVDITTVLFDPADAPATTADTPPGWVARPVPSRTKLLGEALLERATIPSEMARGVDALIRTPRQALSRLRDSVADIGALAWAGIGSPAPPSPFNVDIGAHRRYACLDAELARFKAIKNALGGTVNDVVLTVVSLALGEYLRSHDHATDGLELRAMVPVSVRAQSERGALGNRVAAMWAPLPVGIEDPTAAHRRVHTAMTELKLSNQAVGAQLITSMAGFAPPTILSQAARLQARQRYFNLVVTNVPGPQFPLYLLGKELINLYPVLPLAHRQALGVAVMSYNGHLGFGLLSDYDALPEVEDIATLLAGAIAALSRAAGVTRQMRPAGRRRAPARAPRRSTRRSAAGTGAAEAGAPGRRAALAGARVAGPWPAAAADRAAPEPGDA